MQMPTSNVDDRSMSDGEVDFTIATSGRAAHCACTAVEDVVVGLVADVSVDGDAAALEVGDRFCVVASDLDYVGAADVQAAQSIDEPPEAALVQEAARAIAVEEAVVVGVGH